MRAITHEDQIGLLRDLAGMGSQGRAEGESEERFPRTFYPVPEHARAFDPELVLVIGPRGSGKTELVRAVIGLGLLPAIARYASGVRLPPVEPARTSWVFGYPIGAGFPDARSLQNFIAQRGKKPDVALELWFTYLVRVLYGRFDDEGRSALQRLMSVQGGNALASHDAFRGTGDSAVLALDRLDELLKKTDARIFIGYDELDTLGGTDWDIMSVGIKGLVAFWAGYARRWRRIRAKIFLRTDLFQRHATSGGADLAKLAANRAELAWSDKNLYGMLVKRIANASDSLREYCEKSRIQFEWDRDLGSIPVMSKAAHAKPLIDRMVGPYMGANFKKGLVFRWLLDHIRDGRGNALPRPLVRLIEEAARYELEWGARARPPRLLSPMAIRAALDVVSREHVTQALDEWPWLLGVRERLRGHQVPWDRPQQVEKLLMTNWEKSWGEQPNLAPPADDASELIEYLVEIGAFRARSDGRIDVPDLFLAGLGLKRKGGVRKK